MDNNCLVGCSLILFLCCFIPIGILCGDSRLCVCSESIAMRSGLVIRPRRLSMLLGKGDTLDLILTISIISLAIAMSMGIEMLFDWYIRY